MQCHQRRIGILQHHGLGDLQLEPVGDSARCAQGVRDRRTTRLRLLNCAGERLTATISIARPGRRQSAQAWRSTHSPIGTIRPISSASGMNSLGGHEATLRMAPAQQRLEAGDRSDAQIDHRLKEHFELTGIATPAADRARADAAPASAHPSRLGTADRRRARPTSRDTARDRRSSATGRHRCRPVARRQCRCWCRSRSGGRAPRTAPRTVRSGGRRARSPRSASRCATARWRIRHRRDVRPCRCHAVAPTSLSATARSSSSPTG